MDILKFGGSSVGSAQSLDLVKSIIQSRNESVIVIVSALGGVTDLLLKAASEAESGNLCYKDTYDAIVKRHRSLIDEILPGADSLKKKTEEVLEELSSLLDGVFALKVLPAQTESQIASFGERLSSRIISELIDNAVLFDSIKFIKTTQRGGKVVLNSELTERLVKENFLGFEKGRMVAIVPGFIASDSETDVVTTLGRGGSDYTASIIAAALDAPCLEIWTDVDGFMTADPKIIESSYTIEELSYREAMELCNFGAKVIYAPSLYPVFAKNIHVLIKNTFNPSGKGSIIKNECAKNHDRPVTGISSIDNSCIITVSALSMAGIVGVDNRIFDALARANINIFLVCQSSSETHISFGVNEKDADKACELISAEFAHEISEGSMSPLQMLRGLATVAIVGERMKSNAGTAGKLFSVLGRNGISIIACAQGTEERNISFVIEKKYLRKALNVIHESFFLSPYKELNLFICGIGTVGGNLIGQIASQKEKLMVERGLKLNVVGISRRTKCIFNRDGIDLETWKEQLENGQETNLEKLKNEVIGMNIFNSVFVDCTASSEVATLYKDFFDHSISVVAANKVAASSDFDNYTSLKALARKRGVKFLFETNVGAGLPIINTINALCNSGDRILKIEAVLSGTLNFIFNTISADVPFSRTVRMAQEMGYSEPDPRIDLSGKDVIRKLVILAREAGYKVEQDDVDAQLFIPSEFFRCTMEEFWQKLPELDADFEEKRKRVEAEHNHWRFVAMMEDGRFSVSLQEFSSSHPFYSLEGSNNIILLTTERYHQHPMLIQGYGAGAGVTAAGVFADIMSIANI